MNKLFYIFSVILSAASGFILLGLAGAADSGASMQWVMPRAVIAGVCMIIFAGVAHIAKQRSALEMLDEGIGLE